MGWLFFMSLSDILCHSSFHQYITCIYADVFDDDDDDDDDKNNKKKNNDWCIEFS
jgi:hypothetical protein